MRNRISSTPAEGGFALIEVVVSAVIAVTAAAGIFSLMQVTVHSAGDQRNRTQAYSLAQEDQARMRTMRIPALRNYHNVSEPPITIDGVPYTVTSDAKYVNDVTGLASCGNGSSSADYIEISSSVSWPNMTQPKPTVLTSIVSPPSGSLNPKAGTLSIRAERATTGVFLNALQVSGTSSGGTFTGSTDLNGCAVFTEQAEGTYTMTISHGTPGMVNMDGEPLPATQPVTVNPGSTTSVDLHYDVAGAIKLTFKTAPYSGSTPIVQSNEQVVVSNTEATSKVFGTAGVRKTELEATSLFPFPSPNTYAVYAGGCTANNPTVTEPKFTAGAAEVLAPSGSSASAVLTLPALLLNVKNNGTATNGIAVKIVETGTACPATREFTTKTMSSTAGRLSEPGLPWGPYTVCATAGVVQTTEVTNPKTGKKEKKEETITRHETQTVNVKAASTTATIDLTPSDPTLGC